MIIGIKDEIKLIGISIIACCAVFVCTLFLNYNIDLATIEDKILTEAGIAMYNAQVSMGKVTVTVTGGCLVITSVIMLFFLCKELHRYARQRAWNIKSSRLFQFKNRKTLLGVWFKRVDWMFLGLCFSIPLFAYLLRSTERR